MFPRVQNVSRLVGPVVPYFTQSVYICYLLIVYVYVFSLSLLFHGSSDSYTCKIAVKCHHWDKRSIRTDATRFKAPHQLPNIKCQQIPLRVAFLVTKYWTWRVFFCKEQQNRIENDDESWFNLNWNGVKKRFKQEVIFRAGIARVWTGLSLYSALIHLKSFIQASKVCQEQKPKSQLFCCISNNRQFHERCNHLCIIIWR